MQPINTAHSIAAPQNDHSLGQIMSARLADTRDSIAFVFPDGAISVGDFAQRVDASARWLAAQGVRSGDVIAVWLVNRVEWMSLLFGAARLGIIVAAVNTRYRSTEVAHVLRVSGARLLVAEPAFRSINFPAILADIAPADVPALEAVAFVGSAMDCAWKVLAFDAFARDYSATCESELPDAPVLLFTTSGTTSGPKLVAQSPRSLARHAADVTAALLWSPHEHRLLALLPFCGTFGMTSVLAAFAAGIPIHVLDAFDAPVAASIMREAEITHAFGSDEMFRRILEQSQEPVPFPALRLCGFAAFQPGWRELAEAAQARGMTLHGLYGSSEVQALFSVQPSDAPFNARIEGGGRPVSGDAHVRIRDLESGELAMDGVSGEIEIAAPSRFLGYFNNETATRAATTADGYFRTGDIGHLRGDGTFVYETRAGDAMRLGGFLVGPGEIEDVLKSENGIIDAQVVAVEIAGQARCVAFVIGDPALEPVLAARAKREMAGYKVPARIFFVDAFPVTESANGTKIQRAKLRAMAMDRLEAESKREARA